MKDKLKQFASFLQKYQVSTYLLLILALSPIGYGVYKIYSLNLELENTQTQLTTAKDLLNQNNKFLADLQGKNVNLDKQLNNEIAINNSFSDQIQSITSTVGLLDKLSKTDKELLQKYSNVYFLNENYIPSALSDIDTEFLFRKNKPEKIHTNVKPFLENLLRAAKVDSVTFFVLSAYRSFNTQANLKASYKITYGAGTANKFSADQGYSEHQLGSTVDFTASSTGENLVGFDKEKAYEWLNQNAYKFGFVISYPKGNKFFQYEPWHWRYVGVELATKLHDMNKYFYDMDQREIDTYLVKIFD